LLGLLLLRLLCLLLARLRVLLITLLLLGLLLVFLLRLLLILTRLLLLLLLILLLAALLLLILFLILLLALLLLLLLVLLLLLLLLLVLLLLVLLLLLLLLELLLERREATLDQLVVELRVLVVRVGSQRAPVVGQRIRPQLHRLLRIAALHRFALAEPGVAEVVGAVRRSLRIVGRRRHVLECPAGVVVLAGLVARVPQAQVQPWRARFVDQRLVVLLRRIVELSGVVETVPFTGTPVRIEPSHRHRRQQDRGHRAAPAPPARSARRRPPLPHQRLQQQEEEGDRERELVAQVVATLEGTLELPLFE